MACPIARACRRSSAVRHDRATRECSPTARRGRAAQYHRRQVDPAPTIASSMRLNALPSAIGKLAAVRGKSRRRPNQRIPAIGIGDGDRRDHGDTRVRLQLEQRLAGTNPGPPVADRPSSEQAASGCPAAPTTRSNRSAARALASAVRAPVRSTRRPARPPRQSERSPPRNPGDCGAARRATKRQRIHARNAVAGLRKSAIALSNRRRQCRTPHRAGSRATDRASSRERRVGAATHDESRSATTFAVSRSRLAVGSSARTIAGLRSRALATATRCCSPRESTDVAVGTHAHPLEQLQAHVYAGRARSTSGRSAAATLHSPAPTIRERGGIAERRGRPFRAATVGGTLGKRRHLDFSPADDASPRALEPGEKMEERRLARARRPANRQLEPPSTRN